MLHGFGSLVGWLVSSSVSHVRFSYLQTCKKTANNFRNDVLVVGVYRHLKEQQHEHEIEDCAYCSNCWLETW
jgi:hypothetical protein